MAVCVKQCYVSVLRPLYGAVYVEASNELQLDNGGNCCDIAGILRYYMPVDPNDLYGSVILADAYFENRLHETDWMHQTDEMKSKALLAATQDVDALVYAGYKHTVYELLEANPNATADDIEAADEAQPRQFPRDAEDTVPDDILIAVYEIAHERLRGRDPGMEFENLVLTSEGVGSTRVSSDRSQMPPRHLANGIVSWLAWRYLQPYLDDNNTFVVRRTS